MLKMYKSRELSKLTWIILFKSADGSGGCAIWIPWIKMTKKGKKLHFFSQEKICTLGSLECFSLHQRLCVSLVGGKTFFSHCRKSNVAPSARSHAEFDA